MSINIAGRYEKWSCQGYNWTVFICDSVVQGMITTSTVASIRALHEKKSEHDYQIEIRNSDTCLLTPSSQPAIELKILLDGAIALADICIPPHLCPGLRSLLHSDHKQSIFSGGLPELDALTDIGETSGDVVFDNVLGHSLNQTIPISIKFAISPRPDFIKESLAKLGDMTLDFGHMKFKGAACVPGLGYDMIMGPKTWRPLVASSRCVMKVAVRAMSCDVLSV